jgi:hypothetical protein
MTPETPFKAVAAVCNTAPTPAGLARSVIMLSAGTPGTTGGAIGSATADELSATAMAPRPVTAIALAANSFAKRDM